VTARSPTVFFYAGLRLSDANKVDLLTTLHDGLWANFVEGWRCGCPNADR
jgi:hypothetical protein